ncbi:non-ribosomal peptide synthetase [Sodalis sp. dw_96]|uniref:non-ribosomal peptide synthetase n=1 Tax=Sodalis sp. dw_96 TaxID=2719794 RepID=UPI001BD2EE5C|nr:non-ribosomal peptide synthetase [Sodalis sp. dw_96]
MTERHFTQKQPGAVNAKYSGAPPECEPALRERFLGEYPISEQQRSLWFLSRLAPDDASYNIGLACRSTGELDFAALRDAMQRLAGRHEVLRCAFADEAGVPKVIIKDDLRPAVDFFDLRERTADLRDEAVHGYHQKPFDLVRGPCIRLGLFQCDEREYLWLLGIHHIIADFTTLALVMDELEALYIAETGGDADTAVPEGRTFENFITEERRYLNGGGSSAAKKFWSDLLACPPPPLQWQGVQDGGARGGVSVFFTLPGELSRRLTLCSQEYGVSLFALMLAAWAVFVGQRTLSTDMVIGVPVSRRDGDFQQTLGCFFNMLPLRLSIATATFKSLTAQVRKALGAALEHRHYPFGKIIEDLRIPRDPHRNPLLQTTVNMPGSTQMPRSGGLMLGDDALSVTWGNLTMRPYPLRQQEGQVDLALEFAEGPSGLTGVIKGRSALFSRSDLERAGQDYLTTVQRLITAPDDNVIVEEDPTAESQRVFDAINPRQWVARAEDDIVSRVGRWARDQGDTVAVTDSSGSTTYGQLWRASMAITRRLARSGVGPGHRVGLGMAPGAEALAAMLAIMRTGAAYLPLEPMNPPARIQEMARTAGVRVIAIAGQQHRAAFAGLSCEVLDIQEKPSAPDADPVPAHAPDSAARDDRGLTQDPEPAARDDEGLTHETAPAARDEAHAPEPAMAVGEAPNRAAPGLTAYTLFTSGSTGSPKGIDVLHRNVTAFLDAMAEEIFLPAGQKWTWFHAPSFDLSVWEIWGCLCSGGELIVISPELRSRPDALLTFIQRSKAQIVSLTPSGLRGLLPEVLRRKIALPVRHFMISGEALPGRIARLFLTGETKMWNLYGPSETTVFAMIEQVTADLTRYDTVPLGRPLRFATVAVLDERLRPVPVGESGEICIGGLGVSPGYVGLPELTAERFVIDPFAAGSARMYRSGDRGVWDGQRLHYLGRMDQQIKLNGYRIEIGEIENALGGYPAVTEAAVLLEEAAGGGQLTAVMVLDSPFTQVMERDLRRFLAGRLPFYMLPGRLLRAESLPRNGHNKLDRKKLHEEVAQGHFNVSAADDAGTAGDDMPLLSALQDIWCAVLGRGAVGIDDVFFDIGGNSLTLMQVFSRLVILPECSTLTPADLFRFPTIRSLAAQRATAPVADRSVGRDAAHPGPASLDAMAARRKRARDNPF